MGWWTSNEKGGIDTNQKEAESLWGDGPADILGEAVQKIDAEFIGVKFRVASKNELRRGLEFALGGLDRK